MSDLFEQQQVQHTWGRPEGASFEDWMNSHVTRFSTCRYDWGALGFQANFDPKYHRAQVRYLGTDGMGVAINTNTVPAEHSTFSTIAVPAGHEGPSHLYADVEEVFFIIRDKLELVLEKDDERHETILTDRDFVSVPPDVYREEVNTGDEDALMRVMLGTKKPITPTYPLEYPLAKIRR